MSNDDEQRELDEQFVLQHHPDRAGLERATDTSPCEVCGDPVREGLRYMAGPFASRMFCEAHDPLRGGPRAGYPELGNPDGALAVRRSFERQS